MDNNNPQGGNDQPGAARLDPKDLYEPSTLPEVNQEAPVQDKDLYEPSALPEVNQEAPVQGAGVLPVTENTSPQWPASTSETPVADSAPSELGAGGSAYPESTVPEQTQPQAFSSQDTADSAQVTDQQSYSQTDPYFVNQPPSQPVGPVSVGGEIPGQVSNEMPSGGGGKKNIIVVAVAVILVMAVGVASYLYFSGAIDMDRFGPSEENSGNGNGNEPAVNFGISNGNIARLSTFGEDTILVSKEDHEGTGILGFVQVAASPDKSRLCFESLPPAPSPAVYISLSTGEDVRMISSEKRDCMWSPDGTRVIYRDLVQPDKPINIYSYDLDTGTETNITEDHQNELNKVYEHLGFDENGAVLLCTTREDIGDTFTTDCRINLETGEYEEL
jgi:hypothetical protein